MGKAKKMRSTSHKTRVPPTGGATPAEKEILASMPHEHAEMFQGLTSSQGSIREATCVALAGMFGDIRSEEEDRKTRAKLQRFADAGLFKRLIPLIMDPLRMVRLHALGALRNITVTGGIDVCEALTAENVMLPLMRVLTEMATIERFGKNDLHAVNLLEQAIVLLTNVCESAPLAINELTRGNLLDPIMLIARHGRAHSALHLETLKLLLLITENNPTLNDVFGINAGYQQVLGELIQAEDTAGSNASTSTTTSTTSTASSSAAVNLQTRLHAVGIAMNVRAIMQDEANVARLLPVIQAALAYDAVHVVQLSQQAAEQWGTAQTSVDEDETGNIDPITDEDKEKVAQAQVKCRTWKESVQTLTLALELVADLASAPDDDDEEEDEWASDDEEAMEQYASSQMDTGGEMASGAATVAARVLHTSPIFAQCGTILQGLVAIPPVAERAIARDFTKMRIRVCNALNNLVQLLAWDVVGANGTLPQLFSNFCTLYRNVKNEMAASATSTTFAFDATSNSEDIEASITSAMWSVLRRLTAAKTTLAISSDDANLLMTGALQSLSVETRLNTIGMLGCIGQQTRDAKENAVVGRCLLMGLSDSSVEVVAETLNALFDVYSEEDFDDVFKELGLLPALEATLSAIKAKLRVEKKSMDRDLVAHVKETQLNLVRFIKYKKKHL